MNKNVVNSSRKISNWMYVDTPIYKSFELEDLCKLLMSQKLNVYNLSYLKSVCINQNQSLKEISDFVYAPFSDDIYCQSWTTNKNTDVWDLSLFMGLGNDKNSVSSDIVRIKTTISKICKVLLSTSDKIKMVAYLGNVSDKFDADMADDQKKQNSNESEMEAYLINPLFVTNEKYSSESEFRVVLHLQFDEFRENKEFLPLIINPNDFIDEYIIDPQMFGSHNVDEVGRRLIECGADQAKIKVLE